MYAVENGQRMLVVPQGYLRQSLMHGAHDDLVAGHPGFNKAYERLRHGVTVVPAFWAVSVVSLAKGKREMGDM
jgi:hypothetical protein